MPPVFQVPLPFGANIGGVSAPLLEFQPEAAYDSWLTVGTITGLNDASISSIGVDWDAWTETVSFAEENNL